MGQLWQLDAIDVRDRAEAWREVIAATHLPWNLDRRDDQPPQTGAWVHRRRLGDLDLLDCRCAPCAGERQRSDLVRTDGEYIGVLLVTEGVEVLSQSDHEVVLGAGDMVAWDSVRQARFAVLEPLRKQTLLIPRARFQQILPEPELVTARGIPPTPATGVLRTYLGSLTRADLDPAAAFAAGNAALELLAAALGSVAMPSRTASREGLRVRITQHIEAHLADRDAVRPQRLAAQFAMSVRALHALFEGSGDTVSGYVRRRRLHHARADLLRPPWPTVTAVAHRWGFSDAAQLSRAFRARYDETPRDAQRRQRAAAVRDAGARGLFQPDVGA